MQKPKSPELEDVEFWERMNFLIGDERPYPWSERVGLNRSAFQSARTRGKKPLPRTVKAWADKIGCNYEWLNTGQGEAFELKAITKQTKQDDNLKKEVIPHFSIVNKHRHMRRIYESMQCETVDDLLRVAYNATEGMLSKTYAYMLPEDKTDVLVKFINGVSCLPDIDTETLHLAIWSIEYPLYQTRQNMSHNNKVQLISDIYKLYDSNAEMKKATLDEYMKYKEGSNSGRSDEP